MAEGLKGNPVKIRNSPATVSFISNGFGRALWRGYHWLRSEPGRLPEAGNESGDLP